MSILLNDKMRLDNMASFSRQKVDTQAREEEAASLNQLLEKRTMMAVMPQLQPDALPRQYDLMRSLCQKFNLIVDNVTQTVHDSFEFQMKESHYQAILLLFHRFLEEVVLAKLSGILKNIRVKTNFLKYWDTVPLL